MMIWQFPVQEHAEKGRGEGTDEYYRRDGHRAQRFWHFLSLMLG
jgi:hypothetical protein